MGIHHRHYNHTTDYDAVSGFLIRSYRSTIAGPHRNWLEPRWEYMHHHPAIYDKQDDLSRCGIWFEGDAVVAVAHFEHRLGIAYLQIDPAHAGLKREMLEYAPEHLAGDFKVGRAVHVYLDEQDDAWHQIALALGYERMVDEGFAEMTMTLAATALPERIEIPEGFEILGLDEDDDVRKVHRVMHRGFNHEGEPPEDGLDDRRRKLSAPSLRKDLTVVARAPNGDFSSFCGMWIDAVNRIAMVEPVATDPDYRRQGLGTAVVLEGIRRCAAEGATVAFVGSDQAFYKSMGFEPAYCRRIWRRVVEG